jgi:hypothetical protein
VCDELITLFVEQCGLRRKQRPDDLTEGLRGLAYVVLCAEGVTHEERLVRRWHLEAGGHRWRSDGLCVGGVGQRDRESHSESSDVVPHLFSFWRMTAT